MSWKAHLGLWIGCLVAAAINLGIIVPFFDLPHLTLFVVCLAVGVICSQTGLIIGERMERL